MAQGHEQLEAFLNEFLFENGGCYSLMGDKPVTSIFLFQESSPSLEGLSDEALVTLQLVEINTREHWELWKQFTKKLAYNDFQFLELPAPYDSSIRELYFVNFLSLKSVLEKHRDLFLAPFDLTTLEELIKKLGVGSEFHWLTLLRNHYLAGLLFGYGEENVKDFHLQENSRVASDQYVFGANLNNFPIPIFSPSERDRTSAKYRNQREKIRLVLQGQDLLGFTLWQLENHKVDVSRTR